MISPPASYNKAGGDFFMLGYVHLTAGHPVLERRAAAGMTYWALELSLIHI